MIENYENYINYLKFLKEKLSKFFIMQKPYIFCKKGCSLCCKNVQLPYSQIEFEFLMSGAAQLDEDTKNIVKQNIKNILAEKEKFHGEMFRYDCPFLINDVCTVYNFRGVICRSFGLMNVGSDGRIKVPFCCFQGLNYANVTETENGENTISVEKFKNLGVKEVPSAFNVNYEFLTDADFEQTFDFKFGDKKPLIDWLEDLK